MGAKWRVFLGVIRSTLPLDNRVSALCTPSGSWDREKIIAHFDDEDARFILSLLSVIFSTD